MKWWIVEYVEYKKWNIRWGIRKVESRVVVRVSGQKSIGGI